MLMCNFVLRGIFLSTFSHEVGRILAFLESIAGGGYQIAKRENYTIVYGHTY